MEMMMIMMMMMSSSSMFAGSELCSYELPAHRYPALPERLARCPKLPVPRR